jgi:transcriptional regulator with XRE-family HTH domain
MDSKRKLIYKHIGARIAYFRTLNELSQEELAHRIHLSRATLGKIERGIYGSSISLDTLLDIAEVLGLDLNMIISSNQEERQYWQKLLKNKT